MSYLKLSYRLIKRNILTETRVTFLESFHDAQKNCSLLGQYTDLCFNFYLEFLQITDLVSIAVAKQLRVVIVNCSLCRGKTLAEEQQQPLAESICSESYVQFTQLWPFFWAWTLCIYLGTEPGSWYKYTARQRFPRLPKEFAFQTLIHLCV